MYTGVVNALMWSGILNGMLWVIGIPACSSFIFFMVIAGIRHYYQFEHGPDDSDSRPYKKIYFYSLLCFIVMATMITIGCSKVLEPEYIILRHAAPMLDKFVEKHPDTLYNPEQALITVNDTALALFGSIQEFPKVIEKLASGKSISETKADLASELKKAQEAKELEEFREWQKTHKRE